MVDIKLVLDIIQVAVAILGFVGIIISLLYLAKQTKEATRQSKSLEESIRVQVYQGISSDMLEIDRVFIEHPELRPYFYESIELSQDSPLYKMALSIAEMKLDFYDTVLHQMPHFLQPLASNWKDGIRYAFALSPVMKTVLDTHKTWYTAELAELADDAAISINET